MRLATLFLRTALLCAVSLTLASTAQSGVPSPANSTHDPCFVTCPLGDITYHVTVRDVANVPVVNSMVTLDFSQCAFVHCPLQGPGIIVSDAAKTMTAFTGATGVASFPLAMGGCCPTVGIFADNVFLATVSMTSPDQNASLLVNGADLSIVTGLVGSANACADLDCSGAVNAADVGIVTAHNGHSCTGVVPTRSSTWGTLKSIYR